MSPALFLIFINDIDTTVDLTSSLLSKFADDTKWARIVESEEDRRKFQEGGDGLARWSQDWQDHALWDEEQPEQVQHEWSRHGRS